MTLLYYDARVRREALDLELLAGSGALPSEDNEPLLERSDWKKLGILVLVTIPAIILFSLFGLALLAPLMGTVRGL